MNIVVITADELLPGEPNLINAMFDAGLIRLHIRKPHLSPVQTRDFINNIATEHHKKIVIHRHHGLYAEMGLGGIHMSSFDRKNNRTLSLANDIPADAVSASLHAWDELAHLPFACSYVFISPVFHSISKPGYNAGIEWGRLTEVKKEAVQEGISLPNVYGLGGVTRYNIADLRQEGFDGAAVLGSVWQSPDPVNAFREIMAAAAQVH